MVGKELPIHGQYSVQKQARDFWRRSYWSPFDYASGKDAAGSPILPQHRQERTDGYKVRLAMAMPRRLPRAIIDRYNDFVFRVDAERDKKGPEQYQQLVEDANGKGEPLKRLMRRALRWAQIEQTSYLLADMANAGAFLTRAQEIASGQRSILRLIRADQVVWWRDYDGAVIEALILLCDEAGQDFVWRVTPAVTQRIDVTRDEQAGAGKLTISGLGPEEPHKYGGCPLVRLAPEWDETVDSTLTDSQCAPLAESMRRILNIDSWLFEELQGCTFTTQVFLGVKENSVKGVEVGPGKALTIPATEGGNVPQLGKIGADVTQAESLRKSLDYEIRELHRAAGLSPGNPTEVSAPESGVSKAFAFNEVEARLSALADAGEHAENLVVKRVAAGGGWLAPADANWPDEFMSPDLAEGLDYLIRLLTAPVPDVLKDKAIRGFAANAFELSDQDEALLEQQIADVLTPAANPFAVERPFGGAAPVAAASGAAAPAPPPNQ